MFRSEGRTLEDIHAFSKTVELFAVGEALQDDDDLTKEKKPRESYMSLIDGFIALEQFNQLLSQQSKQLSETSQRAESERIREWTPIINKFSDQKRIPLSQSQERHGALSKQERLEPFISAPFWDLF